MTSRTILQVGVLIAGTALGLAVGNTVGQHLRLTSGRADLDAYAHRLLQAAVNVSEQTQSAIKAVTEDRLPFCSADEIVFMRGIVYRSSELKDIGRWRNGQLACSSEIGMITVATPVQEPDASFRDMKIFTHMPIVLAGDTRAFVVRARDISLVLNPHAFDGMREPSRTYAAYIYDRATGTLVQGFGDALPISKEEITAGVSVEHAGVIYRPLCASWVCVVAAAPRKALLAQRRLWENALRIAGASLGAVISLLLLLFYERHRSQEHQLRRALRRDALTLVYQPIIHLASGAIVGAEAMVRWTNDKGEAIRPDVFVALAENKGFVTQLTGLVLRSALAEMKDLLLRDDFRLTLNIAPQDLADPGFLSLLEIAVQQAGVRPASLGLEITERSTTNHEAAIRAIADLRHAGHVVYIDDFGSGYSSLAYLQDLAVDFIKMDQAFTRTVGTNAVTESIVPQILQIAGQLGLGVVVEGIETLAQAEYFRAVDHGILGQGWYFSRPVSAERLTEMVGPPADAEPRVH